MLEKIDLDRSGAGVIFGLLLLSLIELMLHTDAFLYQYRSVFAAGRAMDKVIFTESVVPQVLLVGNSRVDNGFISTELQKHLHHQKKYFNLGIPGANARVFYGIFTRLAAQDRLGKGQIDTVLLGLDESFLHAGDSLGYTVFFADRAALLSNGEYRDLLANTIKLWGYANNFKRLREPAKLVQFVSASMASIEPIGGAAQEFWGYRAAFGGAFQDAEQVGLQMAGSKKPPDLLIEWYFWQLIDLLQHHQVDVVVFFPPLLNRDVAFLTPSDPLAQPFINIKHKLHNQQIHTIALDTNNLRDPNEFANAGHLNHQGAQRYTKLLSQALQAYWLLQHKTSI